MNTRIENMPTYRIAYIRQVGPYGIDNTRIMEQLKEWARSKDLLDDDSIILGIAHDNPEMIKPEDCRYDTCMVIKEDFEVTEGVSEGRSTGGRYFVATIEHTAEVVQSAWMSIFSEVMNQGHQMDMSRSVIERYAASMVRDHYCEICVPII